MWVFYDGTLFNTKDVAYVRYSHSGQLWWVTVVFKNTISPDVRHPYDTEDEAVIAIQALQKKFNGD